MKKIVMITAFNEESTIEEIIKVTSLFVDKIPVINDGSLDRTANNAKKASSIVADDIVNRNLVKIIQLCYDEDPLLDADIAVQIDLDGQYDPEVIPMFILYKDENRADLVLVSKLDNLKYKMARVKSWKQIPDSFLA